MSIEGRPDIEVILPVYGQEITYTLRNSVIYQHTGRMACVDCIYREDEHTGQMTALFDSKYEQDTLEFYGWEPVLMEDPIAEVLDSYYLMNNLPPEARN